MAWIEELVLLKVIFQCLIDAAEANHLTIYLRDTVGDISALNSRSAQLLCTLLCKVPPSLRQVPKSAYLLCPFWGVPTFLPLSSQVSTPAVPMMRWHHHSSTEFPGLHTCYAHYKGSPAISFFFILEKLTGSTRIKTPRWTVTEPGIMVGRSHCLCIQNQRCHPSRIC